MVMPSATDSPHSPKRLPEGIYDTKHPNYNSTENSPAHAPLWTPDGKVAQVAEANNSEHHNDQKTSENNCCNKCKVGCASLCRPFMIRYNPLPKEPTFPQRCAHACRCPIHAFPGRLVTLILVCGFLYGCLYVLVGKEALPGTCTSLNSTNLAVNETGGYENSSLSAAVGRPEVICTGNFFALYVLFVAAMLAGHMVAKVKLPPLLGMLLIGIALRNVPYIDVARTISKPWSSTLRQVALCIILIRAGLGLDPGTLKRLSAVVFRLAFTPCLVEACVAAVASHVFLGFPWQWGFMLGFVLAAVSPAVVVPSMLALESQGLGVDKGVPTLIIAAASVDDVLAISGFQVLLSISFSQSELAVTLVRGPLEALLGIVYGVVVGYLLWYIPNFKSSRLVVYRFVLLFGSALFALLGSTQAHVPGAGALGALTVSFMASVGWRSRDGWDDEKNKITPVINLMWWIIQPFLFGLIGAEVDFKLMKGDTIAMGLACLCCGLACRMVASFLVVFGTDLTLREKFFIPFAWLPKATVQAAIGSYALDTSVKLGYEPGITLGFQILTIAALSIVITAPIGAALIALLAPRLLKKTLKVVKVDEGSSIAEEIQYDPDMREMRV